MSEERKAVPKPPPSRNRIMADRRGKTIEIYYQAKGQSRPEDEETRLPSSDLRE